MSTIILEDGTGTKKKAKINANGELLTRSVTKTSAVNASIGGLAWSFATDYVSLTTTASFTALWYFKNTSTADDYIMSLIRMSISTGNGKFKLIKNPTAGTVIASGTTVTPQNLNFSEAEEPMTTIKKGSDAQTITDGSLLGQIQIPGPGADRMDANEAIILGPGDSLALLVQPSAAADVAATTIFFKRGE